MALPLLAAAGIGLGTSLLGAGLGSLAGRKSARQRELENRYLASLAGAGRQADLAENYYLDRVMSFDPSRALREYGEAAYGEFRRNLNRAVAELGGAATGAGRLNTGFYDLDQGELVSDLANRYQQALASRAMEAAQMDLSRIQNVGAFGERTRSTYLDLLAGGLDREEAERNARRRLWAQALGSGAGTAAYLYGMGR
jgi:hypothetical protein